MQRDAAYIDFVESRAYPIRAGHHVGALVDGDPAFRRIGRAVESARHGARVTIGSANIGNRSIYGDTGLNVSFRHASTVKSLRSTLLEDHPARDTRALDGRAAQALFREIARAKAERRVAGRPLDGLSLALDPSTHAA